MLEVLEVLLIYGCVLATAGFVLFRCGEFPRPRKPRKLGSSVVWRMIFLLSVLIVGCKLIWTHIAGAL